MGFEHVRIDQAPDNRILVDYAIVSAYILFLVLLGGMVYRSSLSGEFSRLVTSTFQIDILIFVMAVLPAGLYITLFEARPRMATPGKISQLSKSD